MNRTSLDSARALHWFAAFITVLFLAQVSSAALKDADNYDIWDVRIGLPLWAAGMDGKVGIDNREAHVDEGFWDIADNLDFTAALNIEVRYCGHWLFFANAVYLKTEEDVTPGGLLSSV